jgi:purine-binding chemotaxis protein CheW
MTDLILLARVGEQRIAFDAGTVDAVVDIDAVVPVPLSPPSVRGLCAIRSRVVTVIDCARAIGDSVLSDTGRAVTLSIDGHGYAIRVDAVDDVVSNPGKSEAGFAPMSAGWAEVATGAVDLGDSFALLVDVRRLVARGSLSHAA